MGIPMGIFMVMCMGWIWGLDATNKAHRHRHNKAHRHRLMGILWGFLNGREIKWKRFEHRLTQPSILPTSVK